MRGLDIPKANCKFAFKGIALKIKWEISMSRTETGFFWCFGNWE
jgi:hypothetical protein